MREVAKWSWRAFFVAGGTLIALAYPFAVRSAIVDHTGIPQLIAGTVVLLAVLIYLHATHNWSKLW